MRWAFGLVDEVREKRQDKHNVHICITNVRRPRVYFPLQVGLALGFHHQPSSVGTQLKNEMYPVLIFDVIFTVCR